MRRSRSLVLITLATLAFLYLPVLIMAIDSFNAARFGGKWQGFTLGWYQLLFSQPGLWQSLSNTLIIGISSSFASTLLGTLSAYALYRYRSLLQKGHLAITYLPLVMPEVLMGISLLLVFVFLQLELSLWTVFVAHTTFCVSYVTFIVLSRLSHFDFSMIEAAQDLGASRWTTLRKVVIPQLMPAILSGALLAFTISMDDYIITLFVSGPGSTTLPIYIYGMIKLGLTPAINALSALLLFVTFVTVLTAQWLTGEERV